MKKFNNTLVLCLALGFLSSSAFAQYDEDCSKCKSRRHQQNRQSSASTPESRDQIAASDESSKQTGTEKGSDRENDMGD